MTETTETSCTLRWEKPIDRNHEINYTLVLAENGKENVDFHFLRKTDFTIIQTVIGLQPGTLYNFTLYPQKCKKKYTPISVNCQTMEFRSMK